MIGLVAICNSLVVIVRQKQMRSILSLLLTFRIVSAQELIFEDGIYSEKARPRDTLSHKYTLDNISYKLNTTFIYDYYYQDCNGTKYKILRTKEALDNKNQLNLTKYGSNENNTIAYLRIVVSDYINTFTVFDTLYSQTVFNYDYLDVNKQRPDTLCAYYKRVNPQFKKPCGDEATGVIDNFKNIWIHPPRNYTFKILQLCPYPFYVRDYSISKWAWELETGGTYIDPRWIDAPESIKIKYNYERQKKEFVKTKLGELECDVTIATGFSKFKNGELNTELKSYYHDKYGFVKLVYKMPNNDKIVIDLIEYN
jgi:hypothetical protein